MTVANITIDSGPGAGNGPVLDLRITNPLTIITLGVDDDTNISVYAWEIVTSPRNSTAVLSSASAANPTLELDHYGTWMIKLTATLGAYGSQELTTLVGVTTPLTAQRLPAYEEENEQAGARGWGETREISTELFELLLDQAPGRICINQTGAPIAQGSFVKQTGWYDLPGGPSVPTIAKASSADAADVIVGCVRAVVLPVQGASAVADDGLCNVVFHGPVHSVVASGTLTQGAQVSLHSTAGQVIEGAGRPVGIGMGGSKMYIGSPPGMGVSGSSAAYQVKGAHILADQLGGSGNEFNLLVTPGHLLDAANSDVIPIGERTLSDKGTGEYYTGTRVQVVGPQVPGYVLRGEAKVGYLSADKADGSLSQRFGAATEYGIYLVENKTAAGVGTAFINNRLFMVRFTQLGGYYSSQTIVPGTLKGVALKHLNMTAMGTMDLSIVPDIAGSPDVPNLVALGSTSFGTGDAVWNPNYFIWDSLNQLVTDNVFWLFFMADLITGAVTEAIPDALLTPTQMATGWQWDNFLYSDDLGVTTFPFAGGGKAFDIEVLFASTPSVPAYPAADASVIDLAKIGTPAFPLGNRWDGRTASDALIRSQTEVDAGGFGTHETPIIPLHAAFGA